MADSIRQQMFDALITRLKTISVANNYKTVLGTNVYESRTTPWQASELPGLDVREGEEGVVAEGEHHIFTLEIEIDLVVSGTASPRDNREGIADVTQAVGKPPLPAPNEKFSPYARVVPVSTGKPVLEQKDSKFVSTQINLNVVYRTLAFDPYQVP